MKPQYSTYRRHSVDQGQGSSAGIHRKGLHVINVFVSNVHESFIRRVGQPAGSYARWRKPFVLDRPIYNSYMIRNYHCNLQMENQVEVKNDSKNLYRWGSSIWIS